MEMLVIAVVVVAAFAAVLIPLFRRRPGVGDESEFENIPPAGRSDAAGRAGTGGGGVTGGVTGAATGSVTGAATGSVTGADSRAADAAAADPLEREVQRYRGAVRAGTVCRKCGQANPADSIYCYECGERLPLADAKEFE